MPQSLSVDLEDNMVSCDVVNCGANGNLLEFYALAQGLALEDAVEFWEEKIDYAPDVGEFTMKEVAGITDGQFWRGKFVDALQPVCTLQPPDLDTFESIYRFTNSRREYLYGPFYLIFENPFRDWAWLQGTVFEEVKTFEQGVARAQADVIGTVGRLQELGIERFRVSFSGNAFEIEVDPTEFGIRPSRKLHRVYEQIAWKLCGVGEDTVWVRGNVYGRMAKRAYRAELQTMNQQAYHPRMLWRVVNTLDTTTGLFKVELTIEELELKVGWRE